MENRDKLIELLDDPKFRDYVLNGKHISYWESWKAANPESLKIWDLAKIVILELKGEQWNEVRKEKLLHRINASVYAQEQMVTKKKKRIKGFAQYVLFFLLFAVISFLSYDYISNFSKPEEDTKVGLAELIVKSTSNGQKSRITLPDGSAVTLNSGSSIKYSKDYGIKHRDLELSGEGFFEVAKDSVRPFIVITPKLEVTALGTSFNIRSFEPEQTLVQLSTGKVKVTSSQLALEEFELLPGEQVALIGGNEVKKSSFDLNRAFKWKDGVLAFQSKAWPEVIEELERWYGVSIRVEGNIPAHKRVTAEFNRDFLSNVLSSLSFTFDFEYKIEKDQITIKF